jgi:hypothetical protein
MCSESVLAFCCWVTTINLVAHSNTYFISQFFNIRSVDTGEQTLAQSDMNVDNMDSLMSRHDNVMMYQHRKGELDQTPIQTGIHTQSCDQSITLQDRLHQRSTRSWHYKNWPAGLKHQRYFAHPLQSSNVLQHQQTLPVCLSLPASLSLWRVIFLGCSHSPLW